MNRILRPLLGVVCVTGCLLIVSSCATPNRVSSDPDETSWQLVWEESFDAQTLDTTRWSKVQRNHADWGNHMTHDERCFHLEDGMLYLRGINNDYLPDDTSRYLTGGLTSKGKFAFQYGKIEIKARLESATGAWPAIWMLADQNKYGEYPRNGEIDIMEHLNYEKQVYQTIHSYYTLVLGNNTNPQRFTTAPIDPDIFNVYGIEWYPDRIVFTLNGEETLTYPKVEGVDPSQWPFDQPFYLILSMQLGGSWVGVVDPDDLPVQMIIDWVKVYEEAVSKP